MTSPTPQQLPALQQACGPDRNYRAFLGGCPSEETMTNSHAGAPEVASFTKWACRNGLTTTADVDGHIHAGLRSAPQTKTYQRWYEKETNRLCDARDAARKSYAEEVAAGRVIDPNADPKARTERIAAGHPDNPSVLAAQRVLAKRAAIAKASPTPSHLAPDALKGQAS